MTHAACRLTVKYRDRLRNPTLGNRVRATFTCFVVRYSANRAGPWSSLLCVSQVVVDYHGQRCRRMAQGSVHDADRSSLLFRLRRQQRQLQNQQPRQYTVHPSVFLAANGVVSGTTVRALVLGRFSQKKFKKK